MAGPMGRRPKRKRDEKGEKKTKNKRKGKNRKCSNKVKRVSGAILIIQGNLQEKGCKYR